jgi:glutamate racemase
MDLDGGSITQRNLPIGVFDSGIGGLTVLRAMTDALREEDIIYLGDTARVPYGTRSASTVVRYARSCATLLAGRGLKLLVVACNTVSAVALDMLRVELDVPVVGVINPGARAAVEASRSGRIGVIGTRGTVASGAYPRAVAALDTRAEVVARAAPLLVPLAEEGWVDGPVPKMAATRYLAPLCQSGIDTLLLGCTHYPVLRKAIAEALAELEAESVTVVDSATAVARQVARLLAERGRAAERDRAGRQTFLATDAPESFQEVGSRFLGRPIDAVELVDITP